MSKEFKVGASQYGTPILVPYNARIAILGTSGSGKSVLLNNILLSLITDNYLKDKVQVIGIDPKQISLHALRNRIHITTDPTLYLSVLDNIEQIMNNRLMLLKEQERTTLNYEDITVEQPLIIVVIEEALSVVQNSAISKSASVEIMRKYTSLLTKIRCCNIGWIMVSHSFSSETLPTISRDQMLTRFIMKTNNQTNIGMLAPVEECPAHLISEPGQFYFNDGYSSNWIFAKTFFTSDEKTEEIANKYSVYKNNNFGSWNVDSPFEVN